MWFAILLLTGIGLVLGLILAVASVLMAVPKNEKAEAVRAALPGANCGACGYSGCDGYAEALAAGEAKPGLCAPGGDEAAKAIGEILGVSGALVRKAAVVHCRGDLACTDKKLTYQGVSSCAGAKQFYGGDRQCRYGCLGYGDCVSVCPQHAILVENGVSKIDPALCVGCGLCVKACPKGLIALHEPADTGAVLCRNRDKGAATRKICTAGCIGCGKCQKVCEHDAIHVTDNVAVLDAEKCVGCGKCAAGCPTKCIVIFS